MNQEGVQDRQLAATQVDFKSVDFNQVFELKTYMNTFILYLTALPRCVLAFKNTVLIFNCAEFFLRTTSYYSQ